MFQQFIGDGANIFIAIVAVLVGFATALGYLDFFENNPQREERLIQSFSHINTKPWRC